MGSESINFMNIYKGGVTPLWGDWVRTNDESGLVISVGIDIIVLLRENGTRISVNGNDIIEHWKGFKWREKIICSQCGEIMDFETIDVEHGYGSPFDEQKHQFCTIKCMIIFYTERNGGK